MVHASHVTASGDPYGHPLAMKRYGSAECVTSPRGIIAPHTPAAVRPVHEESP